MLNYQNYQNYLKYKNKYLSLKNNNLLHNQSGGYILSNGEELSLYKSPYIL